MISYVCNKCRKLIDIDSDYEAMEIKVIEARPIMDSKTHQYNKEGKFEKQTAHQDLSEEKHMHLCGDCMNEFYNFL